MAERTWKCQRQTAGQKCGARNRARYRKCRACGKARPPRKRPAHMAALDIPYEQYIEINGGEYCGICGALPKPNRKLDRDHEHKGTGTPRGLLCHMCNRTLHRGADPKWLRAAAAYLERTVSGNR